MKNDIYRIKLTHSFEANAMEGDYPWYKDRHELIEYRGGTIISKEWCLADFQLSEWAVDISPCDLTREKSTIEIICEADNMFQLKHEIWIEVQVEDGLLVLPTNIIVKVEKANRILESSITAVSEKCFEGCSDIGHLNIPKIYKFIGQKAFANCKNLKIVEIQTKDLKIDATVFEGCDALETIKIPVGSFGRFEKMMPKLVDKLVETEYPNKKKRAMLRRIE